MISPAGRLASHCHSLFFPDPLVWTGDTAGRQCRAPLDRWRTLLGASVGRRWAGGDCRDGTVGSALPSAAFSAGGSCPPAAVRVHARFGGHRRPVARPGDASLALYGPVGAIFQTGTWAMSVSRRSCRVASRFLPTYGLGTSSCVRSRHLTGPSGCLPRTAPVSSQPSALAPALNVPLYVSVSDGWGCSCRPVRPAVPVRPSAEDASWRLVPGCGGGRPPPPLVTPSGGRPRVPGGWYPAVAAGARWGDLTSAAVVQGRTHVPVVQVRTVPQR